jgi:hypothetical protein
MPSGLAKSRHHAMPVLEVVEDRFERCVFAASWTAKLLGFGDGTCIVPSDSASDFQ